MTQVSLRLGRRAQLSRRCQGLLRLGVAFFLDRPPEGIVCRIRGTLREKNSKMLFKKKLWAEFLWNGPGRLLFGGLRSGMQDRP